jgi:AraC family transcriptional regulator of adaptative response/methylated-DNA-[protein]-cysteine methyltransferase
MLNWVILLYKINIMKTQLNLFKEGFTGMVNEAAILDKTALKERIKTTQLLSANPSFTIKKWEPRDEQLPMYYKIEKTGLGEILIAATAKGITYLGFIIKNSAATIADLKRRFPENTLLPGNNEWINIALTRINNPEEELPLPLHLKGTEFQLSVWEKLILIPFGGVTNYKQLGSGEPDSRDIGAAVGANPVSFLVPCHRVIRADGNYAGFFWGNKIKANLLTYETTCAIY